jgi:hypothetical protein
MILVGLSPGNNAFMPIGLFENRALAEQALLDAGATRQTYRSHRTGRERAFIGITEAFKTWMEAQGLFFYSTGGACDVGGDFMFVEFPVNSISHGYDDD